MVANVAAPQKWEKDLGPTTQNIWSHNIKDFLIK
jgi:hypothetical protein